MTCKAPTPPAESPAAHVHGPEGGCDNLCVEEHDGAVRHRESPAAGEGLPIPVEDAIAALCPSRIHARFGHCTDPRCLSLRAAVREALDWEWADGHNKAHECLGHD